MTKEQELFKKIEEVFFRGIEKPSYVDSEVLHDSEDSGYPMHVFYDENKNVVMSEQKSPRGMLVNLKIYDKGVLKTVVTNNFSLTGHHIVRKTNYDFSGNVLEESTVLISDMDLSES